MGFCVPVYFLFLLGKLPVIQEHPVIKYTEYRLREWLDEIEEMFSNRSLFIRQTDASPNYHTLDDMCDKYC